MERERRARWTEVTHLENRRAAPAGRPWIERVDRSPDHEANDVGRREIGGRPASRNRPVAEDDDPVGDGLHFFDEVRDVDDGVAGAFQLGDEREAAGACRLASGCSSVRRARARGSRRRARGRSRPAAARRGRASPPGRRPGSRGGPAGRAHRPPCGACRRGESGRSARAPCRAGCSRRRSSGARATAPGRSSPRRRAWRRAGAPADTAGRRATCGRRRVAARPTGWPSSVLLPAPFWPTIAHTSPGKTDTSTPSTATVAPNVFLMPRISKRGVPAMASPVTLVSATGRGPACSSALASGVSMSARETTRTPVSMRRSTRSPLRCATIVLTPR